MNRAEGLFHLNNNMLCAVAINTTGPKAGFDNITKLCVLPLDAQLKPSKKQQWIDLLLKPKRPHNLQNATVTQEVINNAMLNGLDADKAAEVFDFWFAKRKLTHGKQIMPLGDNYAMVIPFLQDWLGREAYKQYFHPAYRDIIPTANFENDAADFRNEQLPYPKIYRSYLACCLKVEHSQNDDALDQCVVIAEIYRQMLKARF